VSEPLVSLVTPFLGPRSYLHEAIDSVRAQSLADWELILVDDGADDDALELADAMARADPRIHLVPRSGSPRSGPAAARNRGLAVAKGTFVGFLDGDDLLQPDMLALTTRALRDEPRAAMVIGPTIWWHPADPGRDWVEPMHGRAGRLIPPPRLARDVLLLQLGHVPCIGSVLIRRAAVEAVGGFEESFRLYEDQTLWVKLMLVHPTVVLGTPLSRYRQHEGSASAAAQRDGLYDRLGRHRARRDFLDWVERYVSQTAAGGGGLRAALALASAPYADRPSLKHRCRMAALGLLRRVYNRRWRPASRIKRR
jgi:glycosyltransferase involved in cell wall biosynthesis